jgi:radical SAM-linked protein
VSEARQRWRLVFRRGEAAMYLSHLDATHAWERALRRGGIPVSMSEGFSPRPRLVFAAPLPLGMLAEHELADLVLAERMTLPDLRERLAACLPRGYQVTDLFDVWVGEPALAPQIAAADYRLTLLGAAPGDLGGATERLLTAQSLPRVRVKEIRTIRYDLRPLVRRLEVRPASDMGGESREGGERAAVLWMRLRHSQEGGTGRAEEVVAALADDLGLRFNWTGAEGDQPGRAQAPTGAEPIGATVTVLATEAGQLEVVRPVRERLWLSGEL